jgi:hypothetical protein
VCHGTFWPVLERYLEGLELYRNGMTSRIILIPSVFCATLRKVPTKHHDSQPPRSGYSAAGLFSCLLPIMFFWRLALICYLAVPVQSQAGSSCTVFSTNGIAASNFQYYRFFDFSKFAWRHPSARREGFGSHARSKEQNGIRCNVDGRLVYTRLPKEIARHTFHFC